MDVRDTIDLGSDHRIEIGRATWDQEATSVRNRYPTSTGGFSPRSSSEIPLDDIEHLVSAVSGWDVLEISTCARMIAILSASIVRRA